MTRAGVVMTIKTRSENSVTLKARPLAAGFKRLEISQRMSSTSTADSAIVVENAMATTRLNEVLRTASKLYAPSCLGLSLLYVEFPKSFEFADIRGNTFCHKMVATARNVKTKGRDENAIVDGGKESSLRWRYAGLHAVSSQSIDSGECCAEKNRRLQC